MKTNQWLKLVEYGDHPHREGVQRVTREVAVEMQRKFHSLRARLARKFGGIPVYIGHPDDQNFSNLPGHGDSRSYAWVQDIEAREDGIWILPKWSEVGKTMIENSFFRFLSPRWEMKRSGNFLVPIRLISVGLTNHPNILGDAIANQAVNARLSENILPDDGEKTISEEIKKNKKSKKNTSDDPDLKNKNRDCPKIFEQIIDLMAKLFSVDLKKSIDEIESELSMIADQALCWREKGRDLRDDNEALLAESERFYKIACEKERQVGELSRQLENEKNRSGEHFINFAINRGLILPNESVEWREKYAADPHATSNELLKRTYLLNRNSKTDHLRLGMGLGNREHILALVNERMENGAENYADAWNAVKKLHPTLF
ncbi:MAG: phage protease [Puniceicoccales bacterium]|jgi:hypothetical protein|nr:phage protease [Puniceicoccales bacterium]